MANQTPTLRRALGKWDLTAVGVNQVIGGGIFLMPALIAAQVGAWSPIAFVLAGGASLLVALCFAEVASRFDNTGGSYLYTRAAYGRFVGFEVGWMQWFARVTSQAGIANGVALALGFYWPDVKAGAGRIILLAVLTLALGYVHVRGIRQSSWVINTLTVGKLAPLAAFILIGIFFVDWRKLVPLPALTPAQAFEAGLLLIFTYGGFDTISVPAGESKDPRGDLPFAFLATIAVVTLVFTAAQIVSMATTADVTASTTPMADAALGFMGPLGAVMIGIGSVLSMTGNSAGSSLSGSRVLFALGEHGELPPFFSRVHRAYRTPANAIWFTTLTALAMALSGSFGVLTAASAVARLVTYVGVSLATLSLRRAKFQDRVSPAKFVIPFGPAIPLTSFAISLAMLGGASRLQMTVGSAALAVGAALYFANDRMRRREIAANKGE